MALEATHLGGRRYCVRPAGQLGTCGWHPYPWTAQYVTASSAAQAVQKSKPHHVNVEKGIDK